MANVSAKKIRAAKAENKSPDRLISRAEFCGLAGVALSTVEAWSRKNVGPRPIKIGLRRVGYKYSEVVAFLNGTYKHTTT